MVEKVFISPNRVRAYGNIVNMKTGDDFTLVNSELTVTTDTVDGAEMTVFSMEVEPDISVSATNPYLLSGETTDVVVKLERGLGEPVPNKNVTIEQSVFIDNGTIVRHNDIWILSNATLTRNASDSTLLETTATGYAMSDQYNKIPPNSVVEFDICQTDGSANYAPIYIRNDGGSVSLSNITYNNLGASIGDWVHIKIVFNNTDTITVYSDKLSESFTKTLSATSTNYRMMLYCGGDMTTIKFKNYVVYETSNGVTDENGEFVLNDISVTDDTIFNATYETVSDTCTVEKCRFVDYAVADKHNHNYFNQAGTSNVTITEADMYKEFKTISTTGGNVYLGSSTSFTGFDVGDTWTIIWEKLYIEGYNVAFQCYNGSTTVGINSTTLGLNNSDFQELKFVCDGSSIKAYVDGVYKAQTSYISTGHGYLRINLNNNNGASQVTFRAKNIRIK